MRPRLAPPTSLGFIWLYVAGVVGAVVIGATADHLFAIGVALLTLAPMAAHVRHVGARHAFTEPSAITVILWFYLFIFPLRGLVIAASGYADLVVVRGAVTGTDLVAELLLASASTTVLVESYYLVNRGRAKRPVVATAAGAGHEAIVRLTYLLVGVSLMLLLIVIVEHGGISGARAVFLAHTKADPVQGNTGVLASAWQLFAVPTVWCCAYAVFYGTPSRRMRLTFLFSGIVILGGALLVYGSRLDALLGLIGTWIVYLYSGRRLSTPLVIAALSLVIVLSQPILNSRTGGATNAGVSSLERYSRISSYGILDVSLGVRSAPQEIRAQDLASARWRDVLAYFVPSKLWRGRPNLDSRRLDTYVAQDIGSVNDRNTGFPATYITEGWLIGGWPGAIILSLLFGMSLGWISRRLTRGASVTPIALLTYAFIVTVAWTYYKDGDILSTFVGQMHRAVYFLLLLWLADVIMAKRLRVGRRSLPLVPREGRAVSVVKARL